VARAKSSNAKSLRAARAETSSTARTVQPFGAGAV
jgi:hypothetical protein